MKHSLSKQLGAEKIGIRAANLISVFPLKPRFIARAHGSEFESRARDYLTGLGYRLLAQNVTYKFGELDLVYEENTAKGKELIFVEVRKRGQGSYLAPEETLTFPKVRRLRNAMKQFLLKYEGDAKTLRLDLIAFQGDELKHFKSFL